MNLEKIPLDYIAAEASSLCYKLEKLFKTEKLLDRDNAASKTIQWRGIDDTLKTIVYFGGKLNKRMNEEYKYVTAKEEREEVEGARKK